MNIAQNVSLTAYSTMGLGGIAAYLTEVTVRMELLEALSWAQTNNLPVIMIGGGSNIVWKDEGFGGLVIVNKILRYESFEEDETNVYITVGAGENWDSVVERAVQSGLTGIEALSLIPGTAGGTPVQNVGAYGQEISNVLTTVEAFDTQVGDFVMLAGTDCGFGYRTSRFKTTDHGRFFISAITLHLTKGNPQPPFYKGVESIFDELGIKEHTPATLRTAIIAIRSRKLPDPAVVKNTGSFFSNPIIPEDKYISLHAVYEDIQHWQVDDNNVKISAAWLIEQSGYKDIHDKETGMGTWATQPLVLINEHARSTADLMAFKQKLVDAVAVKFGITLEQEPEILPK